MLLVGLSFMLKLTFHGAVGKVVLCLVGALFVAFTWEYATTQSKTQIADWLTRPDLMLDTSVILTIDVFFQIAFCVLMARKLSGAPVSKMQNVMLQVSLWFPGLLIFPVLFSLLVQLIFSLPGMDFALIGWGTAGALLVLMPLLALGVEWLLPESDMRLEMTFLLNALIALLGVVATVNGRTAAVGTNKVEWDALGGVLALLVVGAIAGFIINKIYLRKKLSKQ